MKKFYLFSICLLFAGALSAYSSLVGSGFDAELFEENMLAEVTLADLEEAQTPSFTLRLIHNNDGESKLEQEVVDGRTVGGAAQFKTAVDSLKALTTPTITLSSGDNFLAGIAFNASLNRAAGLPYYDAQVLDAIGYDAICIGNHDFDFGPDVLEKMITDFSATMPPYLSANLDFSAEAGLQALVDAGRIAPSAIIDVNGEQIGVIGLITESINNISSPRNVTVNANITTVAQEQIDGLTAAGVDKIILISHLQDIQNEIDLVAQLSGVDVVIAGGGDELLTNDSSIALDGQSIFSEYPFKTLDANDDTVYLVTTPGNYRYVGNLVIDFDDQGAVCGIGTESDLILVEGFAADATLQSTVVDSVTAYAASLDQNIIATSEVGLDGVRSNVRSVETNQGNLIADAFVWLAEQERDAQGLNADFPIVAIQNGGGIRNDNVIPAGAISERNTFDMLPFDNAVAIMDPVSPDQLKTILENSVSRIPGTSGRFLQIAGFKMVYDPTETAQVTDDQAEIVLSQGSRIIDVTLNDGTPIIQNGEIAEGAPSVYIATNTFTAAGGDSYYLLGRLNSTRLGFSYQRALFEYIVNGLNGQITAAQYPAGGEGRIKTGSNFIANSDKQFDLTPLGTFATGTFDEGAAEIVAYDATSFQVYATNADANTVTIINIQNPYSPRKVRDIELSSFGSGVNSVEVANGIVAVAVEAETVDGNGVVAFFDTDGNYLNDVTVGVLPDMVTFTPDGNRVLTANEGQPSDDYTIDPEGSVSIINIANGVENAQVVTADFTSFNGQEDALRAQGIRIFGPGASAAQDFEPEYIAVSGDGSTAYVTLQENNALAVVDINSAAVLAVVPLGFKDHSMMNNGIDASNRSTGINICPWPILGMYQPDAIRSVTISGVDYLVTANEGDARDYDTFSEETRVGDLTLDPTAYPEAASLQLDERLGRLRTTDATGDIDGDGDIDQIYSYGSRSFSIWRTDGSLLFDSGDHFEQTLADILPNDFNSNNDENDSFKSRSDDKGPEPEAIEIVELDGSVFALVGLERVGGVMVYDITNPAIPEFVSYVNNRDFSIADASLPAAGDLGIEDINFIAADQSPTGTPLVVTANEVSGTVTIFAVNDVPEEVQEFTLRLIHNNDGESKLQPEEVDGVMVGGAAEFKTVVDGLKGLATPSVTLSSGDNFLAGIAFNASLNRADGLPYYDAEVLDAIGYDAICIGNHDFDFGPDVLEKMITDFSMTMPPYLSANLDFSQEPGLQALVDAGRIAPRTTIDVNGEQVGVVGLITPAITNISSPRNVTVDFNLQAVAQAQIDALAAEGVNKIILVSHLQDINEEITLISELTGVDIVIAGGGDELLTNNEANAIGGQDIFSEYPFQTPDADGNTVYVVTTPGNYRYVGNLVVSFDANGNVSTVGSDSDVILVSGVEPDADLKANVVDSVAAYAESLDQNIIAQSEVGLDGVRGNVRTIETNQGNLITDAFVWLAEQERDAQGLDQNIPMIALQNGGGIRNDNVIPAGPISERNTFDMLPFDNAIAIMEPVTPAQLKTLLENSVSSIPGASGRFAQVSGLTMVYDPTADPQTRDREAEVVTFDGNRVLTVTLNDGTPIVANGEVVEGAPSVYIVTNTFTAAGGDDYYLFGDLSFTRLGFSYQRALFEYIVDANGLNGLITAAQYPEGGEGRITQGKVVVPDSDKRFDLTLLGTYETGIFDEGAAEIVAYDPATFRAFATNADDNSVTIISIENPYNPRQIGRIDMSPYGDGVNSVAVSNGMVAVAAQAEAVDANGTVVFFNTNGDFMNSVEVGVLPDMVTFTPDGNKVLTANEGEPNDDYTIDPEGSVSIIDVSNGAMNATVTNVSFAEFNGQEDMLREQGIRIFGPGASAAQDFEPEFVAVNESSTTAFVTLQENNALAVIDIQTATVMALAPLGYKDHSVVGNGFDASNRSDGIDIRTWPTLGMYQPDAIKSVNINGVDYVVSANEGDARDYDGFSEEERVGGLTLDPEAYPNAAMLQMDENLGRLNSTTATGDTDGDGDIDQIYSYGARSFSIWGADGSLIFDSGDHMEQLLAQVEPDNFNSTNDENDSFKNRSDDKGPEPEAVEIVKLGDDVFALIGLERIGGVAVYDITDPTAPTYVNYVNNRDFSVMDAESSEIGDLGIEDIRFISADDSPTGTPLVLTANEVSGTVTVFAVNDLPAPNTDAFTLRLIHNNDGESKVEPEMIEGRMIGGAAEFKTAVDELKSFNTPFVTLSSGDNFLAGITFNASLNRAAGLPLYDAEILDAIGYDAICIGNHDFDFGPDILAQMINDFQMTMPPYLSANLDFSGEQVLQDLVMMNRIAPRTTLTVNGEQIGVIGLTTPSLANISSPRGVTVDPNIAAIAQAQIDALTSEGVDKIILISHLQSIDNEIDLAGQLTGVDILIAGGGDELLTNDPSNSLDGQMIFSEYPLKRGDANGDTVYIVTTPGNYRYVGNLVVGFDENGVVTNIGNESDVILVEGFAADEDLKTNVVDSVVLYAATLDQNIIAQTEVPLDGVRGNVRTIETNQGNLITDAFLWLGENERAAQGLDPNVPMIAIQNGGGIRNDNIIPVGDVSERTTFDMLPFSNAIAIMNETTPEQLKTVLENSVSRIPGASGRFLQIAGFEIVYDTARAPQTIDEEAEVVTFDGERIVSATLSDGTAIIADGQVVAGAPNVYIATNTFTAAGGDFYYLFRDIGFTRLGFSYQRALFDYIIDGLNGLITAEQYPEGGEGRIKLFDPVSTNDLNLSEYGFVVGPNPVDNFTAMTYNLPQAADVNITMFDLLARPIQTLVTDRLAAGKYTQQINMTQLPQGVYHIRVEIDGRVNAIKVVKQ